MSSTAIERGESLLVRGTSRVWRAACPGRPERSGGEGRGTLWHTMARDHLSMRVRAEVLRGIEREARRTGRAPTSLAADLLEDGLVMRTYPGIWFREGAAGRRPSLSGSRIDVWQVVETVTGLGGDLAAAAAYFNVPQGLIGSAMEFYADHRDEVDAWVANEREHAAEAERRWRAGRQPLPG